MSGIKACFERLSQQNKSALITFVTAGDPDRTTTEAVLDALVEGGADIIELGVPFSDPMADGPAIQAASQRALKAGMTVKECLEIATQFKQKHANTPLVLMGYYNPVFNMGHKAFCGAAAKAGVDGLIIVDLPPEENTDLQQACHDHDIDWVSLIAPTTPAERLKRIADSSRGFLYRVSIAGITGSKTPDATQLQNDVNAMREQTSLPIAIGFGINTAEQVAAIAPYADAVVVGSAIVNKIAASENREDAVNSVKTFVKELAAATKA